jgi:hypothetical protein
VTAEKRCRRGEKAPEVVGDVAGFDRRLEVGGAQRPAGLLTVVDGAQNNDDLGPML